MKRFHAPFLALTSAAVAISCATAPNDDSTTTTQRSATADFGDAVAVSTETPEGNVSTTLFDQEQKSILATQVWMRETGTVEWTRTSPTADQPEQRTMKLDGTAPTLAEANLRAHELWLASQKSDKSALYCYCIDYAQVCCYSVQVCQWKCANGTYCQSGGPCSDGSSCNYKCTNRCQSWCQTCLRWWCS
jgi:hypothetical protein